MSAPDTNVEKQAKRHPAPLIGIGIAVLVAVVAALWWGYASGDAGYQAGIVDAQDTDVTSSAASD